MTERAQKLHAQIMLLIASSDANVAECLTAVAAQLGILHAFATEPGSEVPEEEVEELMNRALQHGREMHENARLQAEGKSNAN